MNTWFTSDTHFGHESIIKLCNRPFSSVKQMDAAIAANWNAMITPGDMVFHLGDFAYRHDPDRAEALFARLNGQKHLIIGNHDSNDVIGLPWAAPPEHLAEVKVDGVRVVLCHYGMRVWPGQRRGAIHLYGHSHGRLPGTSGSLDIGVDCWDFRPVSLKEIQKRLATLPDVDPEVDVVIRK